MPESTRAIPDVDISWYQTLADISPVGIFLTDADGNCLHVNRQWCEIAGFSLEQALGRGWIHAIHEDDLERVAASWYEAAREEQPFHAEYRFSTPQGKVTWVLGDARAVLSKEGNVEGYIGTITDIDRIKHYINELDQSREKIRNVLTQMPVILFAFNEQGRLCTWNREAERVTGYLADEMIGNPKAMALLFPDSAYLHKMLETYKGKGDDFLDWEWSLTAKDGEPKVVAVSNISQSNPINGWSRWGIGVDVTARRKNEQELRERVKELHCLYKLSMLSNQPQLDLEKFLQEAVELLPPSWQYPEITSARIIYENKIFTAGSFAVSPWMLSSVLYVRGCKVGLIEIYYGEERHHEAEGPFLIEERLLLDEIALQISRTIGSVLVRKDSALLEELSTKAEELENFSHTISHDMKTPLTAIGGFAELLGKKLAQGDLERASFCAERIVENTRRMERRLDDLLRLAKIGRIIEPSEEINLKRLIDETVGMMANQLDEARIVIKVDEVFPEVVGDSMRLREVIENLLSNAIRYIGDEPNLISIGCRRQGDETIFYVKDNGIGIDPEHFDTIFELFRRLDPKGNGEGVGLAITRRIIEAHGGRIWVESAGEGAGACFCFTLGHILD
jgi:PAS domain S-box-containing protein